MKKSRNGGKEGKRLHFFSLSSSSLFSLVFIYLINLSILCGFLIIISDEVSLIGFIQSVLDNTSELFRSSAQAWKSIIK